MPTSSLREPEKDGLVSGIRFSEIPPAVRAHAEDASADGRKIQHESSSPRRHGRGSRLESRSHRVARRRAHIFQALLCGEK